ncbi:hypothetical protein D3C81_1805030 [compost metagenome]
MVAFRPDCIRLPVHLLDEKVQFASCRLASVQQSPALFKMTVQPGKLFIDVTAVGKDSNFHSEFMLFKRERSVIQQGQPLPQLLAVLAHYNGSQSSHFSMQLLQVIQSPQQVSGKKCAFTGAHFHQGFQTPVQPLLQGILEFLGRS